VCRMLLDNGLRFNLTQLCLSAPLVILGGIVTSTFLNMIVIPALYLKYGRAESRATTAAYGVVGEPAVASD
jgi:hypothetical protein